MIGKGWKMSCKTGRNVRGKQTVMMTDDELNSGSENDRRVAEKVINVDQRDKLVIMLEYMEGGTKKAIK